jgi:enamine deaminase RidA (YjgF/YER057c/UK114 family)
LAIILAALADLGGRPVDVVRTRTYLVDRKDWEAIGRVHGEIFGEVRPASTMVVVAGLLDPRGGWRSKEAILDDAGDSRTADDGLDPERANAGGVADVPPARFVDNPLDLGTPGAHGCASAPRP